MISWLVAVVGGVDPVCLVQMPKESMGRIVLGCVACIWYWLNVLCVGCLTSSSERNYAKNINLKRIHRVAIAPPQPFVVHVPCAKKHANWTLEVTDQYPWMLYSLFVFHLFRKRSFWHGLSRWRTEYDATTKKMKRVSNSFIPLLIDVCPFKDPFFFKLHPLTLAENQSSHSKGASLCEILTGRLFSIIIEKSRIIFRSVSNNEWLLRETAIIMTSVWSLYHRVIGKCFLFELCTVWSSRHDRSVSFITH